MAIVIRGSAQVALPKEHMKEVLGMYLHFHRDGSYIRNYKFKDGIAYLPLNPDKLTYVQNLLKETIIDQRSPGDPLNSPFVLNDAFKFRDHQSVPASRLLMHCQEKNYGVLKSGCGNGKTVVMTHTAGNLGHKTLILVDMSSLQSQWQEAFQLVWNKDVQIINKNTTELGDVCVATFQLLHLNPELLGKIRGKFGTLLLDEFHSTGSDTRREVLFKMNNLYRIGCTATMMKKGYAEDVLTDFVSGVSVVMEDKNAMKPDVHFFYTGYAFRSNNPDDWGKIMSKLAKDEKRNELIAQEAIEAAQAGRRVLVIGPEVAGLKAIHAAIQYVPGVRAIVYTGTTTLKQDQQLRADLASGKINVILTSKKADKGLDLPSLDYLILAKPANNEAFITQIAGRIVRPLPGKLTPIISDYVDTGSLAECFAKNRCKWYLKLGYRIVEGLHDN